MRVEKKAAYPLLSLPILVYLIGFFGVYIYRGFDNSMFSEKHQFFIVAGLIIIVRAIFWYSDKGGLKKYVIDMFTYYLVVFILGGLWIFFNWVYSLF
tara:strand:+ start:165 stop:455 length:291 start_codon:yes stop_codon:yes gene_type:complete